MKLNKRFTLATSILLTTPIISAISVFAINDNHEPTDYVNQFATSKLEYVVDTIKTDTQLDTSLFTLGKGYRIYYINENALNNYNSHNNISDFLTESNDWLYTINYNNTSSSYMKVRDNNGTSLPYFGGNAEMFDDTLQQFIKNNSHISVLELANDYYLFNDNYDFVRVPLYANEPNSEIGADTIDTDILIQVLIQDYNKQTNEPTLYGYSLYNNYLDTINHTTDRSYQ